MNNDFTGGFMAGYWGQPAPDDASPDWMKAYRRGQELRQTELEIENG